jgi:holo-[acyl-carrier protein] synthase
VDGTPVAPVGTAELGVDIIRVDRIRQALDRFGDRFVERVLTPAEARYVRRRPETFAGRWAAKEAVSKVLGLGVRGIGWRDLEIERLPTGQPAVRLHGRAAERADQLGLERVAVSITHEREYALMRRMDRLRVLAAETAALDTRAVALDVDAPDASRGGDR